MHPVANLVSHSHISQQLFSNVVLIVNARVVDKETVGQVVDLVKAQSIIKKRSQNQMNVDVIRADLIDGAETHFGQQGHPCFNRVEFKRAYLPVS